MAVLQLQAERGTPYAAMSLISALCLYIFPRDMRPRNSCMTYLQFRRTREGPSPKWRTQRSALQVVRGLTFYRGKLSIKLK